MKLNDLPDVESIRNMVNDARDNYWPFLSQAQKEEIRQLEQKFSQLVENANKYEEYFSHKGWVYYSSLKPEFMQEAVDAFESGGLEKAEEVILKHYNPENVEDHRIFLRGAEASRIRLDLIDLAYADYRANLYHAVILNLVTIIDGIVNDVIGRGFHSHDADMDCWGSITGLDGSIYMIKDIYCSKRNKTRTEQIDVPYRHGILHGRDLGYANKIVAAKCWCFLFTVVDWAKDKATEEKRKTKKKPQTLLEAAQQEKELREKYGPRLIAAISFKEHHVGGAEIVAMNQDKTLILEGTPERCAHEFLRFWLKENYGGMSLCFCKYASKRPIDMRFAFGKKKLLTYELVDVHNKAAAISNISVRVSYESGDVEEKTFILTFESKEGKPALCNTPTPGDSWLILDIQNDFWVDGKPASVAMVKTKEPD